MKNSTLLITEECEACKVGAPEVPESEINALLEQLPEWKVFGENHIKKLGRKYSFPNFATALAFTNQVGELAESLQHHPDILTSWGKVSVTWYTHKIGGLHRNDFRCAARCDQLFT
ncbi:MAG: 4a-hydroxytetrahydrobiopterin dehydratase [Neptuniibacter sp.]